MLHRSIIAAASLVAFGTGASAFEPAAAPASGSVVAPANTGKLSVGGFKLFRVPLNLGAAAPTFDELRLVAAIDDTPELAVVSLSTGAVLSRIELPAPATDVIVCGRRIFAVLPNGLRAFDSQTLAAARLEVPLSRVFGAAAAADGAPILAVVGLGSDGFVRAIRIHAETLATIGQPTALPRRMPAEAARFSLGPAGRRLYVGHRDGAAIADLDRSSVRTTTAIDGGRLTAEASGRFVFASDGSIYSSDLHASMGSVPGPFVIAHPTRPLVLSVSDNRKRVRASIDDEAEFGVLHLHAFPTMEPLGEWTAPGVLRARRPLLLAGSDRIAVCARSVRATGDAAELLKLLATDASAAVEPASGLTWSAVGDALVDAFIVRHISTIKASAASTGSGSFRVRDVTERFQPKVPFTAPETKPTGSSVQRETYVFVFQVDLASNLGPARPIFNKVPPTDAEPGKAYAFTPSVSVVGSSAAPVFTKLEGPPALAVDAKTGEVSITPKPTDLGRHRVVIRAALPGGRDDRLAFELEVRAPEIKLALSEGTDIDLAAVSPDGKLLAAADRTRRKLMVFDLDAGGALLASADGETRIDDLAFADGKLAVASGDSTTLVLRDPRTLAVTGRIPLDTLRPRHLRFGSNDDLSTVPRLVASGPFGDGRQWRTVEIDLVAGRAVGLPMAMGGRIELLADGRTLFVGGLPNSTETVVFDLANRRVTDTLPVGRRGGRFAPAPWAWTTGRGLRPAAALHPRLPILLSAVEPPGAVDPSAARTPAIRSVGRPDAKGADATPLWFVEIGSGKVMRTIAVPDFGPAVAVAFTADGSEMVLVGERRAVRLPFAVDALLRDGELVIAGEPPAEAAAAAEWTYRPQLLPELPAQSLKLESAPPGVGFDRATGTLQWTPLPADIGTHAFRISAVGPDGRSAERAFSVIVRPPSQLLTETDGRFVADSAGRYLMRLADRRIEITDLASPGSPMIVDLPDRAGAWAVADGKLAIASADTARLRLVDPATGKVVREAAVPARLRSMAFAAGDLITVDDRRHVRRFDAATLDDHGQVGWGERLAVSPDGSRIVTAIPRQALPRELLDDLDDAARTVEPGDDTPRDPRASTALRRPRAGSSSFLLIYARTPTEIRLLDAVGLSAQPAGLALMPSTRRILLWSEGSLTVREMDRPDAAVALPPPSHESFLDVTVPHAGPPLITARSGRLYRLVDTLDSPRLPLWELDPVLGRSGDVRRPLRVVAGGPTDWVGVVAGDRVYRVPIAPAPPQPDGEPEPLPPATYRMGEVYRWRPVIGDEPARGLRLVSGPPGAAVSESGELLWNPLDRNGVYRVVLVAEGADGRPVHRSFLLRRGRR